MPVGHEAAVGELCLGGEFLVELVLFAGREDADGVALALAPFGAGHQLEPAQLFAREGGAGEGVVLAVPEHVPGDHDQLARDSDRGDVATAAMLRPRREAIRSWKARSVWGA